MNYLDIKQSLLRTEFQVMRRGTHAKAGRDRPT